MDSKSVVKVFKRKDLLSSTHQTNETKSSEPKGNEIKAERRSRRELVNIVSSWVTERRQSSNMEEIEALRRIFGDCVSILSRA